MYKTLSKIGYLQEVTIIQLFNIYEKKLCFYKQFFTNYLISTQYKHTFKTDKNTFKAFRITF